MNIGRYVIILFFGIFLTGCTRKLTVYDTVHPSTDEAQPSVTGVADSINLATFTIPFTEQQTALLMEALMIANNTIQDPLFEQILRDQSSHYPWDHGRLNKVPQQHRADPVNFFLSEFRDRGLPTINDFMARNDYRSNTTTGSTLPCSDTINFNVENMDRPVASMAGTIVHERMHTFCFKHRSNNGSKAYNKCDFAYHAGDITTVIALYRANNSQAIRYQGNLCSTLRTKLKNDNILR